MLSCAGVPDLKPRREEEARSYRDGWPDVVPSWPGLQWLAALQLKETTWLRGGRVNVTIEWPNPCMPVIPELGRWRQEEHVVTV